MTDSATTPTMTHSTHPRPDAWLGVILVSALLVQVVVVVVFLWSFVAPKTPLTVEKYLPLPNGAAFVYRITNPDGKVTYLSRNVERLPSNQLYQRIDFKLAEAFFQSTQVDVLETELAESLRRLTTINAIVLNDVEYDALGNTIERTTSFGIVHPTRVELFAVNNIPITPPLPLLDLAQASQQISGTFDQSVDFTYALNQEKLERADSAFGELRDCMRTNSTLDFATTKNSSTTIFCAGVGIVQDDTVTGATPGSERWELVAASADNFLKGSAPLVIQRGETRALENVFNDGIGTALTQTLQYKEPPQFMGITTPIVPLDETILYGIGSGALVALERTTQTSRWRFQTGDVIYSAPVVANGIAYFGSADKKVCAVRAADGAFVWAFQTRDIVSAAPAVSDGTVYVASEDKHLYALDADTGQPRWTFSAGSPLVAPPVVFGDTVFASGENGTLVALDTLTGSERWRYHADKAILAAVTVKDARVYVGSYDGKVTALDAANGNIMWQTELDDEVKTQPQVARGRVFVTSRNDLLALDATNGAMVWHYRDENELRGAPIVLGEQLWQLTTEALIGISAESGTRYVRLPMTGATTNAGLSSDGRVLFAGFSEGTLVGFEGSAP